METFDIEIEELEPKTAPQSSSSFMDHGHPRKLSTSSFME